MVFNDCHLDTDDLSLYMHPYIEELDKKSFLTLDESAILNAYKGRLVRPTILRRWLREENPRKLSGPALNEWVEDVMNTLDRRYLEDAT